MDIKFRAIELDSNDNRKHWVYGCYVNYLGVDDNKETFAILNRRGEWTHVDPETLGQFTGLHDKNGKEIFEGDIGQEIYNDGKNELKRIGKIVYLDSAFWWVYRNTQFLLSDRNSQVEVIGNIYENPELLGGDVVE